VSMSEPPNRDERLASKLRDDEMVMITEYVLAGLKFPICNACRKRPIGPLLVNHCDVCWKECKHPCYTPTHGAIQLDGQIWRQ